MLYCSLFQNFVAQKCFSHMWQSGLTLMSASSNNSQILGDAKYFNLCNWTRDVLITAHTSTELRLNITAAPAFNEGFTLLLCVIMVELHSFKQRCPSRGAECHETITDLNCAAPPAPLALFVHLQLILTHIKSFDPGVHVGTSWCKSESFSSPGTPHTALSVRLFLDLWWLLNLSRTADVFNVE